MKYKKKPGLIWPAYENGESVPPAYLTRIHGGPIDLELALSLLTAYGIPYLSEYPNNGLFGKLIMGFPPAGMEIFVPETMLEDAQNLLCADICEDEEIDEGEDENEGEGET